MNLVVGLATGRARAVRVCARLANWALDRPWWAYALLVWAVCDVAGPLLRTTPLTHDHPSHIFKAWHFYEKMLPTGRLRGFSHYWAFGFPSGELVPIGEELWVALFRAVTLGHFSWLRTYSLALFGLLALVTFSGYRLARRFFGVLPGLFAGLLMLWDGGGWAQSGWNWMMEYGVWPNTLGICFILLALASLDELAETASRGRLLRAGLLMAAAFLSHQVAVPFFPILVALSFADRWFRGALTRERALWVLAACGLGVALSGFYLLPMLARAPLTLDLGTAGTTPADVAQRMIDQNLFLGLWGAFIPLGFVGAVVALKRRIPGAFLLSAGTGIFVLLSTDLMFSWAHVERILPNLTKVEASRMLVGAKILWFPLVAYALSLPFEGIAVFLRTFKRRPTSAVRNLELRPILAWAAVLALMLPYAGPLVTKLRTVQVTKQIPPENVPFWDDLRPLWEYTADLRRATREHYRIAYDVRLQMHNHLPTLAPVFDDTPIYKVGYTPTQAFWAFPMYSDPRLFRAASVKYLVTDVKPDTNEFRHLKQFGSLGLYAFNAYDSRPFTLIGTGHAELLEFAPERIRIRLKNVAQGARLKIHVANMDHWQAELNGERVRIVSAPILDVEDPMLMEVPAGDGEIDLRYVARASDVVGAVTTLGALPALFFVGWVRRRRAQWIERLTLPAHTWRFVTSAGVVGALVCIVWRLWSGTALVFPESVFRKLGSGELTLDGERCSGNGRLAWRCGAAGAISAERISGLYGTHLCWNAPQGHSLELRQEVVAGEFVSGRYDVRGDQGSIEAWMNGKSLGRTLARGAEQGLQFLQFDTRAHAGKHVTLRIKIDGSPLHCFDFRLVP